MLFRSSSFSWIVLSFVGLVSVSLNSTAQDEKSKGSNSAPSTFTEMMQNKNSEAMQQQQAIQISAENRIRLYGVLPEDTDPVIARDYNNAFDTFRRSLSPVRALYLKHQVAWDGKDDMSRLRDFSKASLVTHQALVRWCQKMAETFALDPKKFGGLGDMMEEMILVDSANDRFEAIWPLAKTLWEKESEHSNELLEAIGYTGYAMNDFELAEGAWTKLGTKINLPPKILGPLQRIPEMKEKWAREVEFREKERQSNSNPRVILLTARGEIVVELFEDQAPQAVANFIFLAERGFFNRKIFFRVIEHFAAQSGCDRGDGSGNVGYYIEGEMMREDHRNIFRGTLFFATGVNEATAKPDLNSASSQFLMAMMPLPQLDTAMTSFGRIIEGEHLLGSLSRMDLSKEEDKKNKKLKPDLIIEARVVRKRDHNYVPEIVSGQLP